MQATSIGSSIFATCSHALEQTTKHIDAFFTFICDTSQPWRIALWTIVLLFLAQHVWASLHTLLRTIQHHGLLSFLTHAALQLPILRSIVAKEKSKMIKKLQADVQATGADDQDPPFCVLPTESLPPAALRARLARKQGKCVLPEEGHSTVSGTVYIAGKV